MLKRSYNNKFTSDVKKEQGNDIVATIQELFLNIEYKSFYKRLTKKMIYEAWEFFVHFVRHMSSKYWLVICEIKLGLKPFYAVGIYSMLQITVNIYNGNKFADKIK